MPQVRKGHHHRGLKGHHRDENESTPICRCRVLYLGSAVPHITKDGLQGIQEPLKELYPDTGLSSLKGIDSWLSVWSNGLLLENVDEKNTKITRFFPIESLHYCAAVRNVLVPDTSSSPSGSSNEKIQKFLPLDSPFARLPNLNHPPLFACILRRTTGIKVLECHAFICKREMAANALVRCCFHAYADSTYAKQLENGNGGTLPTNSNGIQFTTNGGNMIQLQQNGGSTNGTLFKDSDRPIQRSVTPLDSIEKVTGWQAVVNGNGGGENPNNSTDEDFTDGPLSSSTPRNNNINNNNNNKYEFSAEFRDDEDDMIYEGDENHKIWGGSTASGQNGNSSELVYLEPDGTLKSVKSHNSRITKPRQFISPPPPPPPPPQQFSLLKSVDDDASSTNKKKTKKKLKKEIKSQQQLHYEQQQQQQQKYLIRPASMMNLSSNQSGLSPGRLPPPGGRPGSAMSTLTRTRPHPHHPQHQQQMQMHHGGQLIAMAPHHNGYTMQHGLIPQPLYGQVRGPVYPPQMQIQQPPPTGKGGKKLSSKQKASLMNGGGQMFHPGMPMHHHPSPMVSPINGSTPPPMYHHSHGGQRMMTEQEEQQGSKGGNNKHCGEMMMMPSHYATIERGYHYHNTATRLLLNGGVGGEQQQHHQHLLRNGDSATLNSTNLKRGGGSGREEENGGSPFNTGIYRKKGHLNERAFSYSIRQEHRSRSYGSLANLQFVSSEGGSANLTPAPPTQEGIKKEREIIQMVRDLDLSGDEIERSAVPSQFYSPNKRGGNPGNPFHSHHNNTRQLNGLAPNSHGPRITHR